MSTRTTIFTTIFLIAFALAFSLSVFDRLPEQMASHWNTANQVDGYMSRFWGAFLMPIVAVGMLAMFLVIPNIDPLKANIAQFREYFNAFIVLMVVFLVYMHILTMLWNLGYNQFNMGAAMMPALGLIFIFAGIMMRKAKRNFFIGIRTPMDLEQRSRLGEDASNWLDTLHRIRNPGPVGSYICRLRRLVYPGSCARNNLVLGCLFVCAIPARDQSLSQKCFT